MKNTGYELNDMEMEKAVGGGDWDDEDIEAIYICENGTDEVVILQNKKLQPVVTGENTFRKDDDS